MKKILYEIFICVLAIISVVFAVIDMTRGLSTWLQIADTTIYCTFVLDYAIRFLLSKDKKGFFKHNILDLIAIIPFNSAFRVFRTFKIFRLAKITRLTKLTRVVTALGRLLTKCKTFLNTNGFKYMLITAAILIASGGILISFFEDMTLLDGIWWAFVTTTTVGYGDISPASIAGRIVACVLMLVGIGVIGSLTSTITSFFMNAKKEPDVSSDKVNMVLTLYNELNSEEKDLFRDTIDLK